MADKLKPAGKVAGVAAADLKRVVKEILKHKNNASENAGLAGQTTANAVEQYGLDRKGLGLLVALSKQDPGKAQATLRFIVDGADKLGMFDQVDAFDDLVPAMERIVERAKNVRPAHGVPSGKDGDALGDLLKSPETLN